MKTNLVSSRQLVGEGKQLAVRSEQDEKPFSLLTASYLLLTCFLLTYSLLTTTHSYASSGASFLKIPIGARAVGLGNAYTSIANDVTALYWNPAGLSQLNKKELSAMHAQLFADTRFDFFGYAMPVIVRSNQSVVSREQDKDQDKKFQPSPPTHSLTTNYSPFSVGIGAVYLSQGSLEGRGEDRTQISDFSANDLAVTIGASRFITKQSSLGVNLKILQSKISGYSSNGFALDFGSIVNLSSLSSYHLPLTMGFAIQNVGPQMKFLEQGYNLPLTLAGGVSYPLFSTLLISADLKHQPYDSRTTFGLGTEFSPVSILSLRAGYLVNSSVSSKQQAVSSDNVQNQISNLSGLGMGVGFKLGPSTVDYSFAPAGDLGNTQRISLSIKF